MNRFNKISVISFAGQTSNLITSVSIKKIAKSFETASDSDSFISSIDFSKPAYQVEIKSRDLTLFRNLAIGNSGILKVKLADSGGSTCTYQFDNATVKVVEHSISQKDFACCNITFACISPSGNLSPMKVL